MTSIIFLILCLVAPTTPRCKETGFSQDRLSPSGRQAYMTVLKADVFALGGVGVSGTTSQTETAMHLLMKDPNAVGILKELLDTATPEGSLYALMGLRFVNPDEFKKEIAIYRLRPTLPERKTSMGTVPKGQVTFLTGCQPMPVFVTDIVNGIESGAFDKLFDVSKAR